MTRALIGAPAAMAALLIACSTQSEQRRFSLPPEMVPPAAAKKRGEANERAPYTVRMAEGRRVWAAELPNAPGPFEMTIPLATDAGIAQAAPDRGLDPETEAKVQDYLLGVAQVKDLAAAGRSELALVVLEELLERHPKDGRLWVMKGTLHRRAGQPAGAKAAWRRALELAPGDPLVAEALRSLEAEEEP